MWIARRKKPKRCGNEVEGKEWLRWSVEEGAVMTRKEAREGGRKGNREQRRVRNEVEGKEG